MADIKLKSLLNEFIFAAVLGGTHSRETPAARAKRLELVKKNKELRDKFEKLKVKNSETGNEISVKTAMGYPITHPARKAAMVLATQNGLKGYENDMDKFYKDRKKEYDKLKADYQKSKDEKGLKGLLNKINIFNKHENPDDDNYWNGMQKQFKYLSNDDNHEIN
jgi:hypothetical protein